MILQMRRMSAAHVLFLIKPLIFEIVDIVLILLKISDRDRKSKVEKKLETGDGVPINWSEKESEFHTEKCQSRRLLIRRMRIMSAAHVEFLIKLFNF